MRSTLRELGIEMGRLPPGPSNGILDVAGVRVGHVTRVAGDGALRVGEGPVRTGLTVVIPPGPGPWPAASFVINGYGKTMGLVQVDELGVLDSPVFLTNTLSVGAVQQGYLLWLRERGRFQPHRSQNVVVAECNDGRLNDLWGLHVRAGDVAAAVADAEAATALIQGAVGAGTGMTAFGYKGGIGSASRRTGSGAIVAAMVLANCGRPEELRLDGIPIAVVGGVPAHDPPPGSIIVVVATDADLDITGLERMARRTTHGLARTGAISAHGSGDIAIVFSTASAPAPPIDEAFLAVVEATEEAIWNALATARTVIGRDGHTSHELPHAGLLEAWRR